jgi:hypothetical protein
VKRLGDTQKTKPSKEHNLCSLHESISLPPTRSGNETTETVLSHLRFFLDQREVNPKGMISSPTKKKRRKHFK